MIALSDYISCAYEDFERACLNRMHTATLADILQGVNPYQIAIRAAPVEELITGIMNAFLSSQEETLFGDFLEGVAVFVAQQSHDAYKPAPEELRGIDLVLRKDTKLFVVEIKSGPNWGNSSQIQRMLAHFRQAAQILKEQYPTQEIVAVNGCMYGKDRKPRKVGKIRVAGKVVAEIEYWKLCGQDFWHLISGNAQLYTDIIEPLGYRAKKRNMAFQDEYENFLNRLLREFLNTYANDDGKIAWDRLTEFVSKSDDVDVVQRLSE